MKEENGLTKVILDTDIGSDIDDAVCLAYLLNQPHCDLVGITTVSGEPQKRAMLADAICRAAGRPEIPIHSGISAPLICDQRQPEAPQAAVLKKWPHTERFAPNTAVDFLRETIRASPGEVSLLTIGALTNVALLFKIDPEIPSLLKSLHMMVGTFFSPAYETRNPVDWNAYLDPHAAGIVFATEGLRSTSIGLNVTEQCRLPAEECRRRLTGGPLEVVRDAAEVWFRRCPHLTFHDPLAAAAIFKPEVMEYRDGRVDVELQSQRLAGMAIWSSRVDEKPHRIAVSVDSVAYFDHFFEITVPGSPNSRRSDEVGR